MKVFAWIGISLLILVAAYFLVVFAFSSYVSSPGSYNATAYNSKLSNQYYKQDGKVIYVLDGNFFQVGGTEVAGSDPDTFTVIDKFYAKDINNVYFNGEPVAGASPESVTSVALEFDKKAVDTGYLISNGKVFCYGEVIEGADADSFFYLHGSYSMDKDYLYHYIDNKTPLTTKPEAISRANDRYIRHGEQVLYLGKVISHDASSFNIIDDEYATDALHVYSNGDLVEGMVPEGFTVISPYYRKDKNQAYYFNTPIPDSDPASFKVLNDAVSKDKSNVYYSGYIVANRTPLEVTRSEADELQKLWKWRALHLNAATVILVPSDDVTDITNDYYVYNNEVYSRAEKLAGINPEGVIVLDENDKAFVRIDDQVFYYGSVISGADPKTFTVMSNRFSKDASHVYWSEHRVTDAKPSTFEYKYNLYAGENEAGEYVLKMVEY